MFDSLEARRLLAIPISTFNVPHTGGVSQPASIVSGPDGNLWFTETFGAKIGRITTAGANVTNKLFGDSKVV